MTSGTDETLWRYVNLLGLALLKPNQMPTRPPGTYSDAAKQAWNAATALKLQSRRGRVNRDYAADLLFFARPQPANTATAIDWASLERVMVAGETVWEHGQRTNQNCGVQLRRD
jgi:hypothetical protein